MSAPECDGTGFEPEFRLKRGRCNAPRITPMPLDYDTVGEFYVELESNLRAVRERQGESAAFCGDPLLQLSPDETILTGAVPVICLKTASAALKAIVEQGEGAPENSAGSHFQRFIEIREELIRLKRRQSGFRAGISRGVESAVAPPRPAGRPHLDRERGGGRDGGRRQCGLRPDAPSARLFLWRAATRSGEGARGRSGHGIDACVCAACRARREASDRPFESPAAMRACRSRQCAMRPAAARPRRAAFFRRTVRRNSRGGQTRCRFGRPAREIGGAIAGRSRAMRARRGFSSDRIGTQTAPTPAPPAPEQANSPPNRRKSPASSSSQAKSSR